jgi:hypothetical protein
MYLTEDVDTSYAFALDTAGVMLDDEPITHDAGDPDVHHPAPIPGAQSAPPVETAHLIDRGAVPFVQYTERILRAHDEVYVSPRWEQEPTQGDLTVATLRGDNALKQNNDDTFYPTTGYRLGWLHKRFVHRRMYQDERRHDERWLRPRIAANAVQSPAVSASGWNRYVSPFGWNVRAAGQLLASPSMRRQPTPWSEPAQSDLEDDSSSIAGDWVIG